MIEYLQGVGPTKLLAQAPNLRKSYLSQEDTAKAASEMGEKGVAIGDGSISIVLLDKALDEDSNRDSKIASDATLRVTFRSIHARIDPATGDAPATGQHFFADSPSPWRHYPHVETRLYSFSLTELESHIEKIKSLREAGKGIEGYEACLYQGPIDDRRRRDWETHHGRTYVAPTTFWTIPSGQTQGTEIQFITHFGSDDYGKHYLTGPTPRCFKSTSWTPTTPERPVSTHHSGRPVHSPAGPTNSDMYTYLVFWKSATTSDQTNPTSQHSKRPSAAVVLSSSIAILPCCKTNKGAVYHRPFSVNCSRARLNRLCGTGCHNKPPSNLFGLRRGMY